MSEKKYQLRLDLDSGNLQEEMETVQAILGLIAENEDLHARIEWLINTYTSFDEDGVFTFPDGESYVRRPSDDK